MRPPCIIVGVLAGGVDSARGRAVIFIERDATSDELLREMTGQRSSREEVPTP